MPLNKKNILDQINKLKPSHIIIGYSGGVDSSVLLNILNDVKIPVIAIHINHNINSQSSLWQQHCHEICKSYDVEFISYKLENVPKGESFEAWASRQRMSLFQQEMSKYSNPLLLLGHHQDDQAETFFIQAIRGSGLAGLAGMPYLKKLKYGQLLRPLLRFTKTDIENFAIDNNIAHIYDDSNDDNKYRRNLIRNEVIPILREINPSISKTLSRSANICAESNNIIIKLLNEKIANISYKENIIVTEFAKLDVDIKKSLLHLWFKNITNIALKNSQISSIINSIDNKVNTGWQFEVSNNYKLAIEYNQLKIKVITNKNKDIDVDNKSIIAWLKRHITKDINFENIVIRERQSTDKCKYIGRDKNNTLKILFQELKIPAQERYKAKVITLNDKIIAIYPFFICQ